MKLHMERLAVQKLELRMMTDTKQLFDSITKTMGRELRRGHPLLILQ